MNWYIYLTTLEGAKRRDTQLFSQEEADEEDDMETVTKDPGAGEFTLPMDDYEQLIFEHRQDDQSSRQGSMSPTITPSKRKSAKKESSPTSSITGSNASTPEPEEGKLIV